MRVLSIIPSAAYAGPHNQAVRLVAHAEAHSTGLEMCALVPAELGNAAERLNASGVPTMTTRMVRPRRRAMAASLVLYLLVFPFQVHRLVRCIRESRAEVVELHGLLSLDAAVACLFARRPVVWQLIDTRPSASMIRLVMPIVRRLTAVFMTTGEALGDTYGIRGGRVPWVVFYPAASAEQARHAMTRRQQTRQRLGASDSRTVVANVANFNPQKGHTLLLQSLQEAARSHESLGAVIVGSIQDGHNDYYEQAKTTAEDLGDHLLHFGALPEDMSVLDVLAAADAFVFTPDANSEGVPTVIIESLNVGTPVIATDAGATREVLAEQRGTLVPRDPLVIAGIVVSTLERGERNSERVAEWVASHCSEECMYQAHVQAYQLATSR